MAERVTYVHHVPIEIKAFQSPTGMCGQYITEQKEKVAAHARLLAPKPGQGKGYATGKTAASIKTSATVVGRSGPEADVIADTDYSIHVHEPTHAHVIKPRYSEQLIFFSRKAGRVLFKDYVKHPGTQGNPFLVKALRVVFGGPGR